MRRPRGGGKSWAPSLPHPGPGQAGAVRVSRRRAANKVALRGSAATAVGSAASRPENTAPAAHWLLIVCSWLCSLHRGPCSCQWSATTLRLLWSSAPRASSWCRVVVCLEQDLNQCKEAYGTYEDKCHSCLLNWNFCLGPVYDFTSVISSFSSYGL